MKNHIFKAAAVENASRITTGGGFYFLAPRDTGQKDPKMEKSYILHRKGQAAELVTAEQVINNALEQECKVISAWCKRARVFPGSISFCLSYIS